MFDYQPAAFRNPQRFNWLVVARLPGAFPLVRRVLGGRLNQVLVPLAFEQPHGLKAVFWFAVACLAAFLSLRWMVP